MIYHGWWGSHPATILFKYLSQSVGTLALLMRERPQAVFVMTPPVAACVPVWLYCLLSRSRFVIDAHTGAFLDSPWERVKWLQKFFCRRAAATIVTSEHLKGLVESWGANAFIVTDVPPDLNGDSSTARERPKHRMQMTLVSSFGSDEPIEEFVEAARQLPEIAFFVTGDLNKAPSDVVSSAPSNVSFTGFIDRQDYLDLLRSSDAVVALTKNDHTMQRGAYEGIYLGRPVVTSRFSLLQQAFPIGTVHVDCDSQSIVLGLKEISGNLAAYQKEAEQLRSQKLQRWQDVAQDVAVVSGVYTHAA